MNVAAKVEVEPKPDLKALLNAKGITCVLFIDDAFEDLADTEPRSDEQDELWAAILADDKLLIEAGEFGISEPEHLTAKTIASLISTGSAEVRAVMEAGVYVSSHAEKLSRLTAALEYLGELGLEVRTAGRPDWEGKLDGTHIVFLDWYLGADGDLQAIENASKIARKIHESGQKPLIVLISSDPGVKKNSVAFRDKSGLITGLFDAMPKEWLKDHLGLQLQMTALSEVFRKGHVVQGFVENIEKQSVEATKQFNRIITQLTLSDYANLQYFSLKADGHPLGDYLMEMLSGVWSDALFQGDVKKSLSELNREDFTSLPAFVEPSATLAQIYNSAVFDMHVGDFEPHPHTSDGKEAGLQLSLGDLIVEETADGPQRAFIVMNPECDLAASPRGNRSIPDERSILLLPGELVAINHPQRTQRKTLPDTPYLVLGENQRFRVHWLITEIQAVAYKDFRTWLGQKTRRAAMRPLHVLALQQAVHAHLTRVGLPSPPPLYEGLTATINPVFGGQYIEQSITLQQGQYVMARDADQDQITFTSEFVVLLKDQIQRGLEQLGKSTVLKDGAFKTLLETTLADPDELAALLKPFKLGKTSRSFLSESVVVCRGERPTKEKLSRKNLVYVVLS
ncbi:MAG: hypothetical protein EOR25_34100 [Mesorhizobium sp.]|uniref:hypothetical protein n=1 Tax=Mesorhizobium sp. TaxID=1871066 RepID=UPI000FE2F348|nr:hypothetical protein [Mesorhizobium sp.]RWJ04917.1 MAG: hypothetical protein EOR24_30125 [Mesorhizobium sp.]RWJ09755.1 MAG: hypothetical protein EOR25_34100 [Mesorhizobium sp.]